MLRYLLCLSVSCFSSLLRQFLHKLLVWGQCVPGEFAPVTAEPSRRLISADDLTCYDFGNPSKVLPECLVLTEMLRLLAKIKCGFARLIQRLDTWFFSWEMIPRQRPVLERWCILVQGALPLLRGTFASVAVRSESGWRAAVEAAIMALLGNNSGFFLSNFVRGF